MLASSLASLCIRRRDLSSQEASLILNNNKKITLYITLSVSLLTLSVYQHSLDYIIGNATTLRK